MAYREAEREAQRRYREKNRAKMRAKALERYYARHEQNKEAQRVRARMTRLRGAIRWKLCEPRGIAAWCGRLRWRSGMVDSQDQGGDVWDRLQMFGAYIRRRERHSDLGSKHAEADRWLREFDGAH